MGWRKDWLYMLVFHQVRVVWDRVHQYADRPRACGEIQLPPDAIRVQQYAGGDPIEAFCRGPVLREWQFDGKGFSLQSGRNAEGKTARSTSTRGTLLVEGVVGFYITSDRRRVVFNAVLGPLYGHGTVYMVQGQGRRGRLIPDPNAKYWVS